MRIEKVARLVATNLYSNEQIALSMNVCPQTIVNIKAAPEFHAKMMEIRSGVISEFDKDLRESEEAQLAELKSMVPAALLALRNAILSPNPNIALKASLEILDRDGNLAKVSKVSVHHEEAPDMSKINMRIFDIMSVLGRPVGQETSNDVLSGFTVSATEADGQVKTMADAIDELTLAEIDLGKGKPN